MMTPGTDLTSSPNTHTQPSVKCRIAGGRDHTGGGSRLLAGNPILLPYLTSNSRNSMSITNTKGLLNMPGQNNCFLNSAVQVLWHLDIFRRSFRELTGHTCMAESCIFCALKELFAQFQYSQESALPPDALRRALAETFSNQRRFQLGFMDDAAECFENILLRIHFHIANKESEDMCSASHCIPHQKFAMTLVEQTVCHACGATSEPLPFTQMIHYVPSSALCSQAKVLKSEKDDALSFGELLRRAGGLGDLRDCPSACGTVIQIRKTLMNRPEIVSIGLVWDSEKPTIDHIMDVFSTIGMTLKLQDVFHSVVDSRWAAAAIHQLVGIVTYYGKHYSTFFFHTKLRVWIYFDDAAVREIGPKWEQVVDKCCRGHFQPLLLLYANPYGTSISTSTAPHNVVLVGNEQNVFGKDSSSTKCTEKMRQVNHSQFNENQRRAVTPNPENSYDNNASIRPRRAVTPNGDVSHSCLDKENTCVMPSIITEKHKCESSSEVSDAYSVVDCTSQISHSWRSKQSLSKIQAAGNSDFIKSRLINGNDTSPIYPIHGVASKIYTSCDSKSFQDQISTAKNSSSAHCFSTPFNIQPNHRISSQVTNDTVNNKAVSSFEEDKKNENTYISRRAVENVLHLQKLQRQKSMNAKNGHVFLCQRNSNSSLESLENIYSAQDKGVGNLFGMKFDIHEAINIPRRRDSGNWSGDRNSASSSSTTSLDNPHFYSVGNKRALSNGRILTRGNTSESVSTDPGYDSFSLSSSDSYPSVLAFCPGKADPRLGQILENQQAAFVPYDVAHLQHCVQDLSKKSENHVYGFRDECEKLCTEADIFLAKSVERENIGDISMAALLSDSAAAKARSAMDVPYSSPHSLSLAKLKHSMCIIRSCNLQKKLKDVVAQQRARELSKSHLYHESSHENKHGDQNTLKKGNFDLQLKHNCTQMSENSRSCTPHKHLTNNISDFPEKNIEIYATLPKKSLKKKNSLLSFVESLTSEDSAAEKCSKSRDELYQEKNNGSESFHSDSAASQNRSSSSESGSSKSYRKKSRASTKYASKDSDLSDYSSEWEHSKKSPLYRTYSGPPSQQQCKDIAGDIAEESNQLSNQQTKKQHKIRRKLIGGFMRRKNRSLPDLREGQDKTSSLSRAYDDCDISQKPLSLKVLTDRSKKLVINDMPQVINKPKQFEIHPNTTPSLNQCKDGISRQKQCLQSTNSSNMQNSRTHTPPPYKPPPPPVIGIGGDGEIHKRFISHNKDTSTKQFVPPFISLHSSFSKSPKDEHLQKSQVNLKCNSSFQNGPISSVSQNCALMKNNIASNYNSQESPKGSAVWLKELQLKQEELIQKKKLQEERLRHEMKINDISSMYQFSSGNRDKISDEINRDTSSSRPRPNDIYSCSSDLAVDEQVFHRHPKNNSDIKDIEQNNTSVRYLTSKFEKITHSDAPMSENATSVSNDIVHPISEKHNCSLNQDASNCNQVESSSQPRNTVQKEVFSSNPDNNSTSSAKPQTSSPSVYVYSSHLSDAQLSNVLHIGVNGASTRNMNSTSVKDSVGERYPAQNSSHSEVSSRVEVRRPEKPPDYETAIQRLEIIRGDRAHLKHLDINRFQCIDLSLLEHDKRRRSPKKSVTFSDKVVLVACAGDEDNDFLPNPLLQRVYKQHMMQNTPEEVSTKTVENSTEIHDYSSSHSHFEEKPPVNSCNSDGGVLCNLCHNKSAISSNIYCSDCAFYMSRFQK